jgi:hypothetical protein
VARRGKFRSVCEDKAITDQNHNLEQKMNVDRFWEMIELTHKASNGATRKQAELIVHMLSEHSEEEILQFDRIVMDLMDRAYQAELWDAADVIACGCSDDGFDDFRDWLVAQGKRVYEAALLDPESLAEIVTPEKRWRVLDGSLQYVGSEAYERKTGKDNPVTPRASPVLRGELKNESDLPAKFPKLAARLGECDDDTYDVFDWT